MDNKVCRNCGKPLTSKVCSYCGATNFTDPVEYSDFTTKKLSTKKILIVSGGVFILVVILATFFIIRGIKPEYNDHDTSVNSNQYKCVHAKSCDGTNCIYVNDKGIEEKIICESNNWYS